MAKPFVKWAGGKGKLLNTLESHLPKDFDERQAVTYVEPFVGGGAMLFYMLDHHPNIKRAIINDINPALVNCYRRIKNNHISLIRELKVIHNEYYQYKTHEERRDYYYRLREEYNNMAVPARNTIRAAVLFLFFNKTCFNGLYRENNQGFFNVPFGRYKNPTICNEDVIISAHEVLQRVEITLGDYADVMQLVNDEEYNFFYFDPPYRPMLGGNNFKQYTLNSFDDPEQEGLKGFCDEVSAHGGNFLLSNSDSELSQGVFYFDLLYSDYFVEHITAPRSINAHVPGVQLVTEVLIKNY